MTVTLVVFINDIDTLHKGLYQRYQHIWLCVLCVFTEGQQPFFYLYWRGSVMASPGVAALAWHGGILQLKLVTGT